MTNDINQLLPVVKQKCELFLAECEKEGLHVVVTGTYRSVDEQNALYAQGRTKPGNIVTNAPGGESYHNWRTAFDCAIVEGGKVTYSDAVAIQKMGKIGEACGLDWGGDWAKFQDKPHFDYNLGYTWQEFLAGTVDLTKFNLSTMAPTPMYDDSPESPARAAGTTGNAVLFELRSKETGEVVPHIAQGSDSNDNFFMRLQNGTDVVFVNGENPDYIFKALN